jgi:type III secretion protein R
MTTLNPVSLILLLSMLALAPSFLMMCTSYVKIVVVFMLVRNALGVQQVPPMMVLNGLAMALTLFIMMPVFQKTWDAVQASGISVQESLGDPTKLGKLYDVASPPLVEFLKKNTDRQVISGLKTAAERIWPKGYKENLKDDSMFLLLPSFVLTELTKAFKIGFLLYLPFIIIDLIISNILLAMGMMMVSPMTISLPFKLLLFVTLDGWLKISQGLMYSYY